MADKDNKLDISSFSIQNTWLEEVAPKYFNVDDISMLKIGLFGYVNDTFANAFEDSLHMQTIMSKEIFPNKAVLPDSIYAYSALADYTDFYAEGAVAPMVLVLKKDDVIKEATDNVSTGYKELKISRYSTIYINSEIPFIFDYDIKIICRPTKAGDYIISAQYIMDEINPISDVKTPFLKSVVLTEGSEQFIYINVNTRQLEHTVYSNIVYSNDITEILSFEVEYEGKLAGFNVYYYPNSISNERRLLKKYFTNSSLPDSTVDFCMYNFTSSNKIAISFSAHPSYFRPEFNSKLDVEVFTTLGEEGNFRYEGVDNSLNLRSIDENQDLGHIESYALIMGDSKYGKNEPSLFELKQRVIREFSTRKNIITESDLQRYFEDKSENCDIFFCKKRDDLIKRLYTAFILLRNDEDQVVPTNTIDAMVFEEQFDNYSRKAPVLTLKTGTIFEGCMGRSTFTKPDIKYDWTKLVQLDSNLTVDYPASENDPRVNYLYGTPFLIKVNTNPLFLSYYLNSVYDQNSLSYIYMDESSYEEFIMSSIDIERNAIKQDYYTISAKISTTVDMGAMFKTHMDNGQVIISGYKDDHIKPIKLYGLLKDKDKFIGYIPFEPHILKSSSEVIFRAKLDTDDYINTEDKINIKESIYACSGYMENLRANFALSNDTVQMQLLVYYNGYDNNNKGNYAKLIPGVDDYTLCNVYETNDPIQLFKNLNSIMSSNIDYRLYDVAYEHIEDNSKIGKMYYKLSKIPVIRYLYMYDDENMRDIVKKLDYFKDVMTNALPAMENNFNLDTKFYNSYGESNFFTIGRNKQNLDMTSISIKLNIKLDTEVTNDLIKELKTYISNFVETTNISETGYLYISNLIRALENEFSEIKYIEFSGFNDYDSSKQIIENNFTDLSSLSKEQIVNFVPEYLNINRHIVLSTGELIFEPRIFLTFI